MQAPTSFGLVGGIVFLAALRDRPDGGRFRLIAVPVFLVGLWLSCCGAASNAPSPLSARRRRVPSTEEAAADPAADSGVADVARSSSGSRAT